MAYCEDALACERSLRAAPRGVIAEAPEHQNQCASRRAEGVGDQVSRRIARASDSPDIAQLVEQPLDDLPAGPDRHPEGHDDQEEADPVVTLLEVAKLRQDSEPDEQEVEHPRRQ